MFDFDSTKLIAIGIIALIVIGPKELPGVLRQLGHYIAKMRRMAGEFQTQFSDAMRESELQELKKDMEKMAQDAKVDFNDDLLRSTERDIHEAVDKAGKPVEPVKAAEIKNPTPENDPDGAFIQVDIPPPPSAETVQADVATAAAQHAPVREVGLDPEPAASPAPLARAREA
jgi:sec-independent protein translocase protein TatB